MSEWQTARVYPYHGWNEKFMSSDKVQKIADTTVRVKPTRADCLCQDTLKYYARFGCVKFFEVHPDDTLEEYRKYGRMILCEHEVLTDSVLDN